MDREKTEDERGRGNRRERGERREIRRQRESKGRIIRVRKYNN